MGVRTGDRADVRRAVCRAVRVDDYRAFLVLRVSRASSRALSSRGRPPWTPPAHYVLHLLHRQSSCRGFGRAFSRAFGRASCRASYKASYRASIELHIGV